MPSRLFMVVFALSLIAGGDALAQNRVRTETIRPPQGAQPAPVPAPGENSTGAAQPKASARAAKPATQAEGAAPEIITNLSRLPPTVARTRERILAAARSGDLQQVLTLMQSNETMPVFSLSDDKNPITYWKANYPDSDGVEILSILVMVLETGFVHVDRGTPQEMYLWPYFARTPLKALTPAQKVELFKIVTGSDYRDMLDFGAYVFYRVGIGPDGTWHFFVSGD
jgi:hypothetical protein